MLVSKEDMAALKAEFKKSITRTVTKGQRQAYDPAQDERPDGPTFSISKYLGGQTFGSWRGAALEKRLFEKALSTDADSAGGVLSPTSLSAQIIPYLHDRSVMRNIPGLTIVPMGNMLARDYGAVTEPPTFSYGSEGGSLSEDTSLKFGSKHLELSKMSCMIYVSSEMLRHPGPDADLIIKNELSKALAEEETRLLFVGKGGNRPQGIYYNSRVNRTDLAGVLPSYDDLMEGEKELLESNAQLTYWAMAPVAMHNLRTLKDGNGDYQLGSWPMDRISTMDVRQLWGRPVFTSNQIPVTALPDASETAIFCGDASEIMIGDGDMRLDTSEHARFSNDQICVRCIKRFGILLAHAEAQTVIAGCGVS